MDERFRNASITTCTPLDLWPEWFGNLTWPDSEPEKHWNGVALQHSVHSPRVTRLYIFKMLDTTWYIQLFDALMRLMYCWILGWIGTKKDNNNPNSIKLHLCLGSLTLKHTHRVCKRYAYASLNYYIVKLTLYIKYSLALSNCQTPWGTQS